MVLSHAGADRAKAAAVAHNLHSAGIDVRFDRHELHLGDPFLTFMEEALSTSDYCLLLWSHHASATEWVRMEWEAALYRSVQEKRSFLIAGRLEDLPLPALIAPRLRADLFPQLQPGLGHVIDTWRADRVAEQQTQRPVASAPLSQAFATGTSTIYVTSEAFGITTPLVANLDEPAGLYLDRIVDAFRLPKVFDHDGRIGVRFSYRLKLGSKPLEQGLPLSAQQVVDRSVLWLETVMTPYAQYDPIAGSLEPATFRHRPSCPACRATCSTPSGRRPTATRHRRRPRHHPLTLSIPPTQRSRLLAAVVLAEGQLFVVIIAVPGTDQDTRPSSARSLLHLLPML